jgi:hypothetical protein
VRVHSGGPCSLSPQPNRAPKASADSSSYGAHAYMIGAQLGVRAAEDGHLTILRAQGAWHVESVGCCCCKPTQWKQMTQGDVQGPCIEMGTCADDLISWPNRSANENIFLATAGD